MKSIFNFELGDKVKDVINGYTGIVTARLQHMNGCIRYSVSSTKLKDGKPMEPEWIDKEHLVLVKAKQKKVKSRGGGGDRPAPPSRSIPR